MKTVEVFRGDTWRRSWILRAKDRRPIDLTGATARLMVRDSTYQLVLSCESGDARLSILPEQGRIDLIVAKEDMDWIPATYQFDLEITYSNGIRETIEQENLLVKADVTRTEVTP